LATNRKRAQRSGRRGRHACKLGYGIVSKRLGSTYRSGRSKDWLKFKNPAAPAVKREEEEDWQMTRTHSLPCEHWGKKTGRPKERGGQGSEAR